MRRAVIAIVVIVALLVVADRVAVLAGERAVADQVQTDQHLSTRPDVSIGGFPFLTQAIGGRYDDVTVTMHDLHRTAVRVQTLTVRLRGVHVGLGALTSQHLSAVPVDHATASVLVSYADINAYLGNRDIVVSNGGDGEVRVTGSVTALGRTASLSVQGRIDVHGSDVVVTVGHGLDFTIPLGGMPFSIVLVGAKATKQGITVTATASHVVLHPRQ